MNYLPAAILISLLFCSCNNDSLKNQNELESIVEKSKEKQNEFTENDWQLADKKLQEFKEEFELKKNQMTEEEREKANELIGKYYAIRIKGFGKELQESIKDFGEQMKSTIKELTDSTKFEDQ